MKCQFVTSKSGVIPIIIDDNNIFEQARIENNSLTLIDLDEKKMMYMEFPIKKKEIDNLFKTITL